MTKQPNKRAIVRCISRNTGMSESSIYKILSNPFNFSKETVEIVQREAALQGLTLKTNTVLSPPPSPNQPKTLRIGVVVPSRPVYFWREAIAGISKSKEDPNILSVANIQIVYAYYKFPLSETETLNFFNQLQDQYFDGLIIFPIDGLICQNFIESLTIPTIIFNELQNYMTDAWLSQRPHMAFIGPDGYDEGKRAAAIIRSRNQQIRHMVIICTRHNSNAQVTEVRAKGMYDGIHGWDDHIHISHMELDPTERAAHSILARHLILEYQNQDVDCIYITSGITHVACMAVEKIEQSLGRQLPTVVIGHECSTADHRYLLEGRQLGYIKQDVYTQGLTALRDIVHACLYNTTPQKHLFPSSIFIR